jgi:hypothetical protein
VRAELEAAIGRVITNRGALALLRADFDGFAAGFDLDDAERRQLGAMHDDLARLHRSFVTKRSRALRSSFPYTVARLGDRFELVLGRFTDDHPPADESADDLARFGDFLVDVVEAWDEPRLTIDVARAEHRRGCAARAVIPGEDLDAARATPVAGSEIEPEAAAVLARRAGVTLGRFDHDMRRLPVLATTAIDELPAGESFHAFFRRCGADFTQIWRIEPATYRVLAAMDGRATRCEVEALADGAGSRLAPFVAEGAVDIVARR